MWLTEATQCPVSGKIYLGYFFGIKQLNFLLYISHSRGRFRPSRTITLTISELVAPGRPLGALRPMLPGCGPSSPTKQPQTSQKPLTTLNENGRYTHSELILSLAFLCKIQKDLNSKKYAGIDRKQRDKNPLFWVFSFFALNSPICYTG